MTSSPELLSFFGLDRKSLPEGDGLVAPPHRRVYLCCAPRFDRALLAAVSAVAVGGLQKVELSSVPTGASVRWNDIIAPGGKPTSAWIIVTIPIEDVLSMTAPLVASLRELGLALLCGPVSQFLRCVLHVAGEATEGHLKLLRKQVFPPPMQSASPDTRAAPATVRLLMHGRDEPVQDANLGLLILQEDTAVVDYERRDEAPLRVADDTEPVATGELANFQEDVFASDRSITVVKFDLVRFGPNGALFVTQIRDALKWNVVATCLDLTDSYCGPVLGGALAAILHTNRYLRKLLLVRCSLTEGTGVALARILVDAPNVEHVDLSRNPGLGSETLHALSAALTAKGEDCSLRSLALGFNNSLYVEETRWSDEALCAFFKGCAAAKFLRSVSLPSCGLSTRNAVDMAQEYLRPRQARVDSENASWAHAQRLVGLDDSLSKSPQSAFAFGTIDVSGNAIADLGVTAIFDSVGSAENIVVSHCALSGRGIRSMASTLKKTYGRSIVSIDLSSSDADPVAGYKPWPPPTKYGETIFELEELGGDAKGEEMSEVKPTYAENTVVVRLTPATRNALASNDADPLSPCEHIAQCLQGSTSTTFLDVRKCSIGDAGMVALCNLLLESSTETACALTTLLVSENINLTEEGCAHKVKELLSGGFFAQTPKTQLTRLALSYTTAGIGERALLAMFSNQTLKTLDLSHLNLRDGILVPFATLKHKNPGLALTDVDLSGNLIRTDGLRSLVSWIRQSPSQVKRIALRGIWNSFDDEADRRTSLSQQPCHGAALLAPLMLLFRFPPPASVPRDQPDIQLAISTFGELIAEADLADGASGSSNSPTRMPKSSPMASKRMKLLKASQQLITAAETDEAQPTYPQEALALEQVDLRDNDVDRVLSEFIRKCLELSSLQQTLTVYT